MIDDKISNDDISDLLSKLGDESEFDEPDLNGDPQDFFNETEGGSSDKTVKLYDFKSPDKFSKDQLRTIQMIYENFGRSITTSLSTYLRKFVSIRVSSVDQISYEQFTKSVSNPSLLALIDMYPLKGQVIMEIPPSITFAIVDRILGGEGVMLKEFRELTDIEVSIMDALLHRLLFSLRDVWYSIIRLKPRLETIESNIQFVQIVPPNDTVLVINLAAEIGDIEGSILFCIPYITLESIAGKLYARSIYQNYSQEDDEVPVVIEKHVSNVSVEMAAILGHVQSTFEDILNLQVGDYIMTDRKTTDCLDLKVGDEIKYKVVPGKVGKKLGVKVIQAEKLDEEIKENIF